MYFSPIGGHSPVCGVVQIAHGLGDQMSRYAELAETLLREKFVVYGNDHRGHRLTAEPNGTFGDFGPRSYQVLAARETERRRT